MAKRKAAGRTLLDSWKLYWLRKPVVAFMVVVGAVIVSLATFTSSLDTLGVFLEKHAGFKGFGDPKPIPPKLLSQSDEDCVRPDRNCRLELWLQNPADKPVYIKAFTFRVLDVENEPILGNVEPSASYAIDLSGLSRVGMTGRKLLYQEIGAGKSDRFVLLFGARDLQDRFRRWRLEGKLETSAGVLPIRALVIHLPWDSRYSAGPPVALPTPPGSGH